MRGGSDSLEAGEAVERRKSFALLVRVVYNRSMRSFLLIPVLLLTLLSREPFAGGARQEWDGLLESRLEAPRKHRIHGSFGARPDPAWLQRMGDSSGVRLVPNWIGSLHVDGTAEPYFPDQWSLSNTAQNLDGSPGVAGADIGAIRAWERTAGDSQVIVAFVDGGIDESHPEFAGRLAHNEVELSGKPGVDDDGNGFVDDTLGWDFVRGDGISRDAGGHGTSTASLVAAAWNGLGMAGLAPGVRILPIRVADAGSRVQLKSLVDGVAYASSRGARVINLSLGGLVAPDLLDSAIARAIAKGAAVVVSAGNEGFNLDVTPRYPAASRIPGMVVVGASDARDQPSSYTNRSGSKVDLSAPGDAILAATIPDPDTLWQEDFENGLAGWVTSGTGTAWGLESYQGSTWLSDSPNSNYPRSSRRSIRSPRLNDAGRGALQLQVSLRGRVNGTDHILIECARDSTFARIDDTLFLNGGFQQDSVLVLSLDPGSVDGFPFHLRFSLVSNTSVSTSDSGVSIDRLLLRSRDRPQPEGGAYARVWGTSFSAPLVAGATALLAGLRPEASPESLVTAILAGAQVRASLAGVSRTGARLWIPGAFQHGQVPSKALRKTSTRSSVVASPRGLSVRSTESWTIEWRDLQGKVRRRHSGKGNAFVDLSSTAVGTPLVWTFHTPREDLRGLHLPR